MKALIVLTNVQKYETINRPTGLWLAELTHFYDELVKNNIEADFVSPEGGYIPLDPHSLSMMDETDYKYYNDKDFRDKVLSGTLSPAEVNAADYDLIYYTGGHGTMWDFPKSKEIAEIAYTIYKNGGYVSAVCHGVAGLFPIVDEAGENLIKGKVVTGFTNEEETMNETHEVVPFLTEDVLKELGAVVEIGSAYTPVVKVDGRLLTGQNPQSARALGEAVIEVLKKDGKINA